MPSIVAVRDLIFMNYQQLAEKRRKEAQEVLQKLEAAELDKKLQRHGELLKEIKGLEAELAVLLGVDFAADRSGAGKAGKPQRRRSLTDSQKSESIGALLQKHPEGLSAKRIAEELGDTYVSVQGYLKKHAGQFSKTGEKRSTVYRLAK